MRATLLLLTALAIFGCGEPASSPTPTSHLQSSLAGIWKLQEAGGGDPRRINVESLQLDLRGDGKLAFEAMMTGQYAGMSLKGHGTWKVDGSTLSWTVGANSGTSTVSLGSGTLRLHPDPVLAQPGGKGPIDSAYHR